MVTFYCPDCLSTIPEKAQFCPQCGYEVSQFSHLDNEERWLHTLHHSVPEYRMLAIDVLGSLGSHRALEEFERVFENGREDCFTLREVMLAAAKIGGPKALAILQNARGYQSVLVRDLAEKLLARQDIGGREV